MRKALAALLVCVGLSAVVVAVGSSASATPPIPTQFVSNTVVVASYATETVAVDCPTGTKVTGGGFNAAILNGTYNGSGSLGSYPEGNGWRVLWSGPNFDAAVTAWAVCAG